MSESCCNMRSAQETTISKEGAIFHPVFLSFGEFAFSNNLYFSAFKYL